MIQTTPNEKDKEILLTQLIEYNAQCQMIRDNLKDYAHHYRLKADARKKIEHIERHLKKTQFHINEAIYNIQFLKVHSKSWLDLKKEISTKYRPKKNEFRY